MHDYKNKNPYEILGVNRNDSNPVIERAYRNKIYLYCSMNQQAEDIYGNILKDIFTTALNILTNPITRKQLDQELALKELIEQQCVDEKDKQDTLVSEWFGIFTETDFVFTNELNNIEGIIIPAYSLIPTYLINENGCVSKKRISQIQTIIKEYLLTNKDLFEQIKSNNGLVYTKKEL